MPHTPATLLIIATALFLAGLRNAEASWCNEAFWQELDKGFEKSTNRYLGSEEIETDFRISADKNRDLFTEDEWCSSALAVFPLVVQQVIENLNSDLVASSDDFREFKKFFESLSMELNIEGWKQLEDKYPVIAGDLERRFRRIFIPRHVGYIVLTTKRTSGGKTDISYSEVRAYPGVYQANVYLAWDEETRFQPTIATQ